MTSGRREMDVGEGGVAKLACPQSVHRALLAKFEHFTARQDSICCKQLSLTVFKLTCSWAQPPPPRPLEVTHVMNSPNIAISIS